MFVTVLNKGTYLEARSIATKTRFAITKYRIGSAIHVCQLLDVSLKSCGAGYNSTRPPICMVEGDGTGAKVELTVFEGSITKAKVVEKGSGYSYMELRIIDPDGIGEGAEVKPIYGPSPDYTDAVDFVYEGDSDSLVLRQVSENEVRLRIKMPTDVGDFDIGNIVYFTDDNIPFAMASLTRKVPKIAKRTRQTGNEFTLDSTILISNVMEILNINVVHTEELDPPYVANLDHLPEAIASPNSLYLVVNDYRVDRPTLAMLAGGEWWTIPFISPLSNAVYGDVIDGGINAREGADAVIGGASYRMINQGREEFRWRRCGSYAEYPVAVRNLGDYPPAPPALPGPA